MSLRLVPSSSHPTQHQTSSQDTTAASAPGLADPLRRSGASSSSSTQSSHPLENRLKNWAATQDALKMEGLRRTFGIAEPVRRGMEIKIVAAGEWKPACLGGSDQVGLDVLRGVGVGDGSCLAWEDVFRGDESREHEGFHVEMERRLGMNW